MFKKQIQEFEDALVLAKGAMEHFTLAREIFIQERDSSGGRWGDVIASDAHSCTLTEAVTFAITSLSAFSRLKADVKAAAPIPEFKGAISAVERLRSLADQMYSSANTIKNDDRDLRFGDYAQVILSNTGEIIYQPLGPVNESVSWATDLISKIGIIKSANQVLGKVGSLEEDKVVAAKADAAVNTLKQVDLDGAKVRDQIQHAGRVLSELQLESGRISESITQIEGGISKNSQEIDRILSDIGRSSERAAEQSAVIQAKHADVLKQASEADAASNDIKAFSAKVDVSRKRVDELEKVSERTVATQLLQRDKVESLIQEANKMLSGATVAGLASTFDSERKQLDVSLKGCILDVLRRRISFDYL